MTAKKILQKTVLGLVLLVAVPPLTVIAWPIGFSIWLFDDNFTLQLVAGLVLEVLWLFFIMFITHKLGL